MGKCFSEHVNLVKFHEMTEQFKVIGITSNTSVYSEIRGYKYISKNNIKNTDFDIVIIMADGTTFSSIHSEILELGIKEEHILSYRILFHHNFNVDKCIQLKKNPPSIFSNNCWAGYTYHSLGLEFTSPLINMFESETDYLKLLKDPKKYMNETLQLVDTGYNVFYKKEYPIVKCGDITLNFLHYNSFEQALDCWNRRKQRINWDNLFVMMYTESYDTAHEFTKLPYTKKICFVPFNSDDKSLICVDFRHVNEMPNLSFTDIVCRMATGACPYYDVFDLIMDTKFTKIAETL